jgi:hypothetical protein
MACPTRECAACLEPTAHVVKPCGHPMCRPCLGKWIARGADSCPTCRGVLVCGVDAPAAAWKAVVDFPADDTHAGVTLTHTFCDDAVRVVRTHPSDRATVCGLRVGDVVTHINGIPVRDHERAIAIIDRATVARETLVFWLRARGRSWWRRPRWLPS